MNVRKKMKILKKAQIEVSFNWIYVLIAGGAILLVFIIIAKNTCQKPQLKLQH